MASSCAVPISFFCFALPSLTKRECVKWLAGEHTAAVPPFLSHTHAFRQSAALRSSRKGPAVERASPSSLSFELPLTKKESVRKQELQSDRSEASQPILQGMRNIRIVPSKPPRITSDRSPFLGMIWHPILDSRDIPMLITYWRVLATPHPSSVRASAVMR